MKIMNTKINKTRSTITFIGYCLLAIGFTSCSDDFLEVTKPDGEPLEE